MVFVVDFFYFGFGNSELEGFLVRRRKIVFVFFREVFLVNVRRDLKGGFKVVVVV